MSEDQAQAPTTPETPLRHGNYATYSNHNCRCELCREAHNRWHREYRLTANGRRRTTIANRKSRRIQQQAATYVRENLPEIYQNIVKTIEAELEGTPEQ